MLRLPSGGKVEPKVRRRIKYVKPVAVRKEPRFEFLLVR